MKNSNRLLWSFLGMILFMGSCQKQQKKENQEETTKQIEEVVFEVPNQIISLAEADSLFVNYKQRRAKQIIEMESREDGKPFLPTQFVSFDIEALKKYIGYVEQKANNGGVKADSLRIYLGNYGVTTTAKSRHNTIFMLPTANTDNGYGGIYIDEGNARLIRDYWKNKSGENVKQEGKSKASFFSRPNVDMMYNHESLILNFGGCCSSKNHDF